LYFGCFSVVFAVGAFPFSISDPVLCILWCSLACLMPNHLLINKIYIGSSKKKKFYRHGLCSNF
jgi:hypothetical protein